jgi:hypothetical protein
VAGLLIAPPVAIAVQILFNQLLQQQNPLLAGKTVPELADLRKRVTDIKSMLVGNESEPSPRVASMLERLDELLDEADDMPFPEYPPKSVQQNSSISVQVAQQPSH